MSPLNKKCLNSLLADCNILRSNMQISLQRCGDNDNHIPNTAKYQEYDGNDFAKLGGDILSTSVLKLVKQKSPFLKFFIRTNSLNSFTETKLKQKSVRITYSYMEKFLAANHSAGFKDCGLRTEYNNEIEIKYLLPSSKANFIHYELQVQWMYYENGIKERFTRIRSNNKDLKKNQDFLPPPPSNGKYWWSIFTNV